LASQYLFVKVQRINLQTEILCQFILMGVFKRVIIAWIFNAERIDSLVLSLSSSFELEKTLQFSRPIAAE
jgi:hypothetical protein